MKISFVIPAYNEENHIALCLTSIQDELSRGHYDVEIIVVNNASTDKTGEIASRFPGVIVIDEKRKGVRQARQTGFDASRGELIANIDADNMLPRGWIATVIKIFSENDIVALSGPYRYYDIPLSGRMLTRTFNIFGRLLYVYTHFIKGSDSMICGGNMVIRRSALQKIGGYDTSVAFAVDDVTMLRDLQTVGEVKWSWKLTIYASGRRFQKDGILKVNMRWAINYFAVMYNKKLHTSEHYEDIRH